MTEIRCEHDLAEGETACADGMCPLCAADELARLRAEFQRYGDGLAESVDEINRLRALLADALAGLEPFADAARNEERHPEGFFIKLTDARRVAVSLGDLRRAAEVATEIRKELG